MKIHFKAGVSYTPDSLHRLAAAEGVGWEADFNSGVCVEQTPEGTTWVTAWSHFSYTLLLSGEWVYEGAERGFLGQALLPEGLRTDTEILSVSGTYGSFEGKDALEKYEKIKREWLQRMEPLASPHFRGDWRKFCAEAFALTQKNEVPPTDGGNKKILQALLECLKKKEQDAPPCPYCRRAWAHCAHAVGVSPLCEDY